ncbi:MAG: restriction endonuclease subunit S [Desulfobacterales bacterium]|uniref:Restriction endonuclease subunit S n=1 Tax=Candidatus Desulfatibia vada TaxID=2841696 RepID=A0A8J6TPM2_9BACT|nr:restriction endonuclease subunit S [Candidatus Desulfatibia vada]
MIELQYPENWNCTRLKNVALINKNSLSTSTHADYILNYLEISNVNNRGIISKNEIRELFFLDAPSRARRIVRNGDTVISSVRPNLQAIAYIKHTSGNLIASTGFYVVTPIQQRLDDKYTYYLLISDGSKQHMEAVAKGVGYPAVDDKDFVTLKFAIPSLLEQHRIAAYLDKTCAAIEKAIEAKQKQLEILDALRKSIIHKSATRGLDDSVELKDSGVEWLGRIPIHWNVYRLKDISSKIGSGVTPEGGASSYVDEGIPLFRSQNIHFDGLRLDDIALITEEQHNSMSNTKVQGGDVLLNITGASLGRCHYVPKDFGDANVNQHVCIIRAYRKLYFEFLNFFLSSDTGQKQIFSGFRGASREGLNFREIKNFLLPIPLEKEQVEICNYLSKKFEEFELLKNNLENQISTLEQYRKSLIHECVTGKRRITEGDVQGQL